MEKEKELLEKLSSGEYDGFRVDFPSCGKARQGGRTEKGVYIKDGEIFEFKDRTLKIFDGKENETTTTRELHSPESDDEKLAILQKIGYKMYDHPEVRQFSKDFYNEKDRMLKEAAKQRKKLEEQESTHANLTDAEIRLEPTDDPNLCDLDEQNTFIDDESRDSKAGEAVLVATAVAAIMYGVYKSASYIKKWWTNKVIPFFDKDAKPEEIMEMPCPSCGQSMNKTKGVWKCPNCKYEIVEKN